ncbi:DUF2884 family protein [Teredinibacter purpureus]|uniref:DUF2884 family protein n=1 Tax=Teredinibacter purpureus TaxID=2731756 RepID=UPI0005F80154|nr:DUF2884 family protein [Teredinibacter purpureus]
MLTKKITVFATYVLLFMFGLSMSSISVSGDDVPLNCATDKSTDIRFGLVISANEIHFIDGKKAVVVMTTGGDMTLEEKPLSLDADERLAVLEYQQAIRDILPEMHTLAIAALKTAETVTESVFSELFKLETQDVEALQTLLALSQEKVNAYFSTDTFHFNRGVELHENQSPYSDDFEREFEAAVEALMEDVTFRAMGNVMSELFSSDGNMEDFGKKMEEMGKNIEASVGAMALDLNGQTTALCRAVDDIARKETEVIAAIAEFKPYGLIASY